MVYFCVICHAYLLIPIDKSMDAERIEQLIKNHLPEAEVNVTSPDNVHYTAQVTSPRFAGLNRIAQHRLVHAALGDALGGDIHALSLSTRTPEGHDKDNG